MWIVLFSLSPCTVKEALSDSISIDYAKPLNKAKTTIPATSCSYTENENQQISVVIQSKVNQKSALDYSLHCQNYPSCSFVVNDDYSKNTLSNSPPKYILYKRLKVNLVAFHLDRGYNFHV